MTQRGRAVIVNMASITSLVGFGGVGAYATTEHGVIALTKTAAIEIAEMVSWGASKRVSYCTGSIFVADGGGQLAG